MTLIACDKCGKSFDRVEGFTLHNSILSSYHICIDCSLPLDRFVDTVDKAKERRRQKTREDEIT